MSDALKAIFSSPPLWSALFTAIIATVLAFKPDFPINLITVWLGVASAILAAIGIVGVTGVIPKVAQAQSDRAIKAAIANRSAMPSDKRILASGQKTFEAYASAMLGQTADKQPIPNWHELDAETRDSWAFAERAARLP